MKSFTFKSTPRVGFGEEFEFKHMVISSRSFGLQTWDNKSETFGLYDIIGLSDSQISNLTHINGSRDFWCLRWAQAFLDTHKRWRFFVFFADRHDVIALKKKKIRKEIPSAMDVLKVWTHLVHIENIANVSSRGFNVVSIADLSFCHGVCLGFIFWQYRASHCS